jgi:predicted transcriptional regulator
MLLPPEVESKLVLPLLRSMIVRKLVKEHGYTQEETAKALGITQAAVSNYLRKARAKAKIWEDNEFLDSATDEIIELIIKNENPRVIRKKMYETLLKIRKAGLLCNAHRCLEPNMDEECDICKE